jgi:DNA-binding HxlR family transcriptional regulator
MFGPQGFNTLATGLPGHISRSVLAGTLRKLEEIGLVARAPSAPSRAVPYSLTPAGEQLVPTLKSLWQWAEKWVPADPAVAQRDPSIILWWLTHRVDVRAAPERQVALEIAMRGNDADRSWLLLARGAEPTLCLEDPLIGQERTVYVEADASDLYPIARGLRSWTDAAIDGSVRLYGEPELVAALPTWFMPVGAPPQARTAPAATAAPTPAGLGSPMMPVPSPAT